MPRMIISWGERARRIAEIQYKLCLIKRIWRRKCERFDDGSLACKYSYAEASIDEIEQEYARGAICQTCYDSLLLGPEFRRLRNATLRAEAVAAQL